MCQECREVESACSESYYAGSESWDKTVTYALGNNLLASEVENLFGKGACKFCSFCENIKALSDFGKDSHAKDGLMPVCKSCINAYNKKIRAGVFESSSGKVLAPEGMKFCPTCKEFKFFSDFYRDNKKKSLCADSCKKCIELDRLGRKFLKSLQIDHLPFFVSGLLNCLNCGEVKTTSLFYVDKKSRAGFSCYCKECVRFLVQEDIAKKEEEERIFKAGTTKVCEKCGIEKSFDEFYKVKRGKGGVQTICKVCYLEKSRKRAESLAYTPEPTTVRVCSECGLEKGFSEFYPCKKVSDGLEAICKECRKRKRSLAAKPAYLPDPSYEKICKLCGELKNSSEFYKCNKVLDGLDANCKECSKRLHKGYLENNGAYKLRARIRSRFTKFLKLVGLDKDVNKEAALDFMGCTISELHVYLENLFYVNPETCAEMTWVNHSKKGWHVDHIIPLAKVDLTDPRQLKRVCHYSNLQPMWGKENSRKSAKLPENFDKEAWLREIEND
jgi:hypothetical protein